MRKPLTKFLLTLASGQAASDTARLARTVRVLYGRAWITIEGNEQDYWLFPGDTIGIPAWRRMVIEADAGDCRVEIAPLRRPSAPAKPLQQMMRHVTRAGRGVKAKMAGIPTRARSLFRSNAT